MTSLTVRYASQRGDVWRWYWKAWSRPNGLWVVHVLAIALVLLIGFDLRLPPWISTVVAAAVITGFVLTPQILFKPQERTLTIDDIGILTTIGSQSGTRAWTEIVAISVDANSIVMTVAETKNAFIVPRRAFESEQQRQEFVAFAQSALNAVRR